MQRPSESPPRQILELTHGLFGSFIRNTFKERRLLVPNLYSNYESIITFHECLALMCSTTLNSPLFPLFFFALLLRLPKLAPSYIYFVRRNNQCWQTVQSLEQLFAFLIHDYFLLAFHQKQQARLSQPLARLSGTIV